MKIPHKIVTAYVAGLNALSHACFVLAGKTGYCYICKSYPGRPTDFKQFCSRCGNQP